MEIPGYRIDRQIGAGGMATVYLAVHEALEREVALKVMTPRLATDDNYCRRFLKEGKIAAKLNHRHVLTVFDIGQHNDKFYMAAEYVPDGTLRERITAGLPTEETIRIIDELTQGLSYAHDHGFVHRDVKPGNVLFRNDGSCVLGDFGIAKAVNSNTFATKLGTSLGTPYYMSPEQARGEKVDNRTDLYSVGVVLYECLTQEPPFDAEDPFTVALMQINEPLPKLPSAHSRFQPLLDKLMAKEAANRYPDADAFLADLRGLKLGRNGSSSSSSFPSRWFAAAAGVVLLVAGLFWVVKTDRTDSSIDESPPDVAADQVDLPRPTPDSDAVSQLLSEAQDLVSKRSLVPPADPNAWTVLQAAKAQQPESRAVDIALREVGNTLEAQAESLLRNGQLLQARSLVCDGLGAFPERAGLQFLEGQFDATCSEGALVEETGEEAAEPLNGSVSEVESPDPRVTELLEQADTFLAQDILAFPAGENAMDKYLEVIDIDPANASARKQLSRIANIWADTAEYELQRGRDKSAMNTIELGLRAEPDNVRLLAIQQQLLQRAEE